MRKKQKTILTVADREKVLEKNMMEYLRIRGFYCQKVHSGEVYVKKGPLTYKLKLADRGTPDLFVCIRGRLVCIEVKASPEEHAEWERQWQAHLNSADENGRKQIKISWERSIYQHTEHQKWRDCGAEILVCSSIDELQRDIDFLLSEYDAQK